MSKYSEKLAQLKKEIVSIENVKKKKRWKPYQKTMIDFINGVTQKAEFNINDMHEIVKRGIKLGNEGVSNDSLDVYMFLKNDNNFRLVLKPQKSNSWVVTFYRKS